MPSYFPLGKGRTPHGRMALGTGVLVGRLVISRGA